MNPASGKKTVYILITLVFFLLAIILFLVYFLFNSDVIVLKEQSASTETAIPTSIQLQKNTTIAFLRDNEVWQKDPSGNEKVITSTGNSVKKFSYSNKKNLLATLEGKLTVAENYQSLDPEKVVLYDLSSSSKKELITIPIVKRENSDYMISLRDIEFSQDGNILGITSSDSFWTYNTQTQEQELIFTKPVPEISLEKDSVYSYIYPKFSTDNSWAILSEGHYEWLEDIAVNLQTKEIKELPYGSSHGGWNSIAWISPTTFLVSENIGGDQMETQTLKTKISEYSVETGEKKEFMTFDGGPGRITVTDNFLFFVNNTGIVVGQGQYGDAIVQNYQDLVRVDRKSKAITSLYRHLMNTDVQNQRFWDGVSITLEDDSSLYVEYHVNNSKPPYIDAIEIWSFNPNGLANQTPTVVAKNASFMGFK